MIAVAWMRSPAHGSTAHAFQLLGFMGPSFRSGCGLLRPMTPSWVRADDGLGRCERCSVAVDEAQRRRPEVR